jgi:hypothetical protein
MSAPPLKFQWDGDALVPASGFWRRQANEHFVVGAVYRMVEEAERSQISHSHEFAWLKTAWDSLPDDLLAQYPSPEHLRKRALIAKGHCTMTQHACKSVAEAERLEAAIGAHVDTYAVVVRRGPVVTVYTAVSQSRRAMGAPQFQASKNDIIDYVAGLLQVDPDTLGKQQAAA